MKNDLYDIEKIAEKNCLKRFIYFKVTLRDKINYDIELTDGFVNLNVSKNNKKNHIIYACQNILREEQKVPPRFNSYFMTYKPDKDVYKYETTTLDILVECSNEEFKRICEKIYEKNNYIELLLRTILEFFAYKYNLAVNGNDFIEGAELCVGNFSCFCFYKDKKNSKYINTHALVAPSMNIINNSINAKSNLQEIINTDIPTWKYFYNKTKFCYYTYNNLDCIINASITFESYLIFLIKENKKYIEYLNNYKNKLGFNSSLQFAKDNKIISDDLFKRIKDEYEKISKYRAEVLHGVIESPIIDRNITEITYKSVINTFNDLL